MERPNHSAHIWLAGDWLYLDLPAIGGIASHTVRFPDSPGGLQAALHSLRNRHEASQIGTPGDPTQHNINQLIAEFEGRVSRKRKIKITPAQAAAAKAVLRKRGMIT